MVSYTIKTPASQMSEPCGHNRWLLHAERLLSTTCMGWCLHISFMEHPKSSTMAYAGGALSLLLTNFFLNQPRRTRLLRAGEFLSVAGIVWCMQKAIDEHPKAAIKACLAGALSFCLTKAVIFSGASATENKPKMETVTSIPDLSEMYHALAETNTMVTDQLQLIGKQLNLVCEDYCERKIASK